MQRGASRGGCLETGKFALLTFGQLAEGCAPARQGGDYLTIDFSQTRLSLMALLDSFIACFKSAPE